MSDNTYGANSDLEADLCVLLDHHGLADHADTSPIILARYLIRQLDNFRETLQERNVDDNSRKQSSMGSETATGGYYADQSH